MSQAKPWSPSITRLPAQPMYLAIVEALRRDIHSYLLRSGDRLPTHRELAKTLEISVGTVTHAYAEAQARGLITCTIGRGSFVGGATGEDAFFNDGAGVAGPIDLSLNLPPIGTVADELALLLSSTEFQERCKTLLGYLPHQGIAAHRNAAAQWLRCGSFKPSADQILICNGGQHALAVAVSVVAKSGDTLAVEDLTYSGVKSIGTYERLSLAGVRLNADGLDIDDLRDQCRRKRPKALYIIPTIQNPTGIVYSRANREAVAEIAEEFDLIVLESDVYRFLAPDAPDPIAALIPHRTIYLSSVSKSFAPGLRVGYLVAPPSLVAGLAKAIRATAWMAVPIMAEVAAHWINTGTGERLAEQKRTEAIRRQSLARDALGPWLSASHRASFHAWVEMPEAWQASEFASAAQAAGVTVTPPGAVTAEAGPANGIRIGLGAARSIAELERALAVLRGLLQAPNDHSSDLSII